MTHFGCSFNVEIITTVDRLHEKLTYWERLPFIAIDTEFVRVDTFYPLAGLIQVADDTGIYLIDPVEIKDLTVMEPLLTGKTLKVMHSMSEDIVLFQAIAGCMPQNIFDTQIACALLGHGISISYQNFIERFTGLVIDKGETRSDWLKRPLSDSQIEYAAKDAHYLYEAYPKVVSQLEERKLTDIVQQECQLINLGMVDTELSMDHYYLKVKGGSKLPVNQQVILKQLTAWREREARKRDKPRGRIISDKQFLELLERMPKTLNALQATRIFNSGQLRRYGDFIISVINNPPIVSPDFKPIPHPLSGQKRDLYRLLKKAVDNVAEKWGMTPELLGKKRLLEQYVTRLFAEKTNPEGVALPETFGEWRIKLLDSPFKEIIKSKLNV